MPPSGAKRVAKHAQKGPECAKMQQGPQKMLPMATLKGFPGSKKTGLYLCSGCSARSGHVLVFFSGDGKVVGRCMVVNSGVMQIMCLVGMRSKLGGDANHVVVRVCALTFIGHWSESCITWFDASGGFSVTVLVIVSSLYSSGS